MRHVRNDDILANVKDLSLPCIHRFMPKREKEENGIISLTSFNGRNSCAKWRSKRRKGTSFRLLFAQYEHFLIKNFSSSSSASSYAKSDWLDLCAHVFQCAISTKSKWKYFRREIFISRITKLTETKKIQSTKFSFCHSIRWLGCWLEIDIETLFASLRLTANSTTCV